MFKISCRLGLPAALILIVERVCYGSLIYAVPMLKAKLNLIERCDMGVVKWLKTATKTALIGAIGAGMAVQAASAVPFMGGSGGVKTFPQDLPTPAQWINEHQDQIPKEPIVGPDGHKYMPLIAPSPSQQRQNSNQHKKYPMFFPLPTPNNGGVSALDKLMKNTSRAPAPIKDATNTSSAVKVMVKTSNEDSGTLCGLYGAGRNYWRPTIVLQHCPGDYKVNGMWFCPQGYVMVTTGHADTWGHTGENHHVIFSCVKNDGRYPDVASNGKRLLINWHGQRIYYGPTGKIPYSSYSETDIKFAQLQNNLGSLQKKVEANAKKIDSLRNKVSEVVNNSAPKVVATFTYRVDNRGNGFLTFNFYENCHSVKLKGAEWWGPFDLYCNGDWVGRWYYAWAGGILPVTPTEYLGGGLVRYDYYHYGDPYYIKYYPIFINFNTKKFIPAAHIVGNKVIPLKPSMILCDPWIRYWIKKGYKCGELYRFVSTFNAIVRK